MDEYLQCEPYIFVSPEVDLGGGGVARIRPTLNFVSYMFIIY